jgi:hypothetical protein
MPIYYKVRCIGIVLEVSSILEVRVTQADQAAGIRVSTWPCPQGRPLLSDTSH